MNELIWWNVIDTDIGQLGLASTETGLLTVLLPNALDDRDNILRKLAGEVEIQDGADRNDPVARQLHEYATGKRKEFNVKLDQRGTKFQIAVWNAVYQIPWGQTASYGDISRRIGKPNASRAVGAANGANPHPIIVPCHRIIGADGSLTGYGGGMEMKKTLLKLEGVPVSDGAAFRTMSLFSAAVP